ncbi:ligand-binding sensor domain-containing diguanylate cyclase [Pseudidiomarina insulisalsae]|nr:ligand-binding sensor domain-containing diguanylate cyclase [Pseudidiomarina insulisalsae]
MRVWSAQHGLPHNSINHITQDSQGYLWLATWQGTVRFNGRTFTVFDRETQLPDAGSLFVGEHPYTHKVVASGARGGVAHYDPQSQQWRPLPRIFNRVDYVLFSNPECTWYGTVTNGVVRECDGLRRQFTVDEGLPSNTILHLAQDSHDRVWAGTDRGPAYFDHASQRFQVISALPNGRTFGIISEQQSGDIYLSVDRSLFRLSPDHLQPEPWPVTYPSTITELYQAPNDDIWVGTHEHGLTLLQSDAARMTTVDNGLPNNHILSIFADRENTLWVGTHRGLIQFRQAPFHSHRNEDGLGYDYVRALYPLHDGSLLVGGLGGIKRIKDEAVLPFAVDSQVQSASILTFAQDSARRLYVGTFTRGLYVLENGEERYHYDQNNGFPGNDVRSILLAADGYLYAATSQGVLRSRRSANGELEPPEYFGVAEGLPDEIIYAIHEAHNGEIWIGSMRGLSKLVNGSIERVDLSDVSNAEFIFGFHETSSHILIASDRGLLTYRKRTGTWQVFDEDNGLPFAKFFDVVLDHAGNLWLASGRGLLYVSAEHFDEALYDDDPATPVKATYYHSYHGLASAQVNTGGSPMLVDRNNHLWVATSRGVGHFIPEKFQVLQQSPPRPVIESVIADQESVAQSSYLSAETGRIEFQFAGLGFHYPEGIRYRVQLAGYDNDWVTPGTAQTRVAYTELPPGAYIFQVQAAYPEGQWSDAATFTFHKLPKLWQRPVVWLLTAVAVIVLIILAFRLRSYRLQRSKERLQKLVREQTKILEQLAHQDSLTGLANRRAFDELLRKKTAHAEQQQLGLVLLDLDNFKDINDRYLHTTGDKVLQRVARVTKTAARNSDMIARWGGEEFAVLISDTDESQLQAICERMRNALLQSDLRDLVPGMDVSASFGAALHQPGESAASLIRRADKALYQAKSKGRNRTELADAD